MRDLFLAIGFILSIALPGTVEGVEKNVLGVWG